ncbi:MAG: isochorismatase family protein [Actinomycetaceae bacterium]|nr:isochorismatase family protein [Actinomycetaceae bacterium]
MTKALLVVDVQPTFCEGGELGVEGGNQVAADIADFVRDHRGDYALIITTQDWHIKPGEHFSDNPDFVGTWPPHGIAESENAKLHPALADLDTDHAIKKGQFEAAYSGFEGESEAGYSLLKILRDAGVDSVDVVGLALSHCVKETALDAQKRGFAARVITRLSAPVSPELGEAAVAEMKAAGVTVI